MLCRPFLFSLGWIFFGVCSADAQWVHRDLRTEPSTAPGVVHQHVVLENPATSDQATLELAKFSPTSARLRLVDNPDGRDIAAVLGSANNVGGVNGGYFDERFAPLGLRIAEGKKLSLLVRGRLLSGIVVASGSKIQILRLSEFGKGIRPQTAIQCGPFLIDRGAAVAGLDSKHTARRTFIALSNSGEVLMGYCSNASLAELPAILAGYAGDTKIQRALNLDGGSSSAFWFKRKDGSIFSIGEQKSVRDFVAIAPQ